MFSAGRGVGAHLLKVGSKRKRTKAEMTVARRSDLDRAAAIAEKTQEIEDLRLQLSAANSRAAGADGANL